MINRAAVVLKCKKEAVKWINEVDPIKGGQELTLADVNSDRTVYLISDHDIDGSEDVEFWVNENYQALFEVELQSWYTDESLWPINRNLKLFKKWFTADFHTMIIDTVDGPIFDDET
jgi:hypothetical protein